MQSVKTAENREFHERAKAEENKSKKPLETAVSKGF